MAKVCGKSNGEGMWKTKWRRYVEKKMVKVCGKENESRWKRKW